jgi:hypothetical protein
MMMNNYQMALSDSDDSGIIASFNRERARMNCLNMEILALSLVLQLKWKGFGHMQSIS